MTDEQAEMLEVVRQAAEALRDGANADLCKVIAENMEKCIPNGTPIGDVLLSICAIAAKSLYEAPTDTKRIVTGAIAILIRGMAERGEQMMAEREDVTLQ
jgi:hypothetical protein